MIINFKKVRLGIGIALILIGVITLLINSYSLYIMLAHTNPLFPEVLRKVTFGRLLLKQQSTMVIAVLAITSGILLLRNRKIGWILAVAVSSVYTLLSIMSYWNYANSSHQTESNGKNFSMLAFYVLLFSGFVFLLTSKPFRAHFNPIKKDWLLMTVIFCLLLINFNLTR